MNIAVNFDVFPGGLLPADVTFLKNVFAAIARQNPEHHFLFISNEKTEGNTHASNTEWIKSGVNGPVLLKWRYWYSIKLPAILKKHKAVVFISADCFSVPLKIPQLLTGINPDFFQQKDLLKRKYINWYKKGFAAAVNRANGILLSDNSIRHKVAGYYKISAEHIQILLHTNSLHAGEINIRGIKDELTGGREFFINTNTINRQANHISLLKAFSLFKKRQQTSMKLVLAGKEGDNYERLKKDLETYKYRDDVVLVAADSLQQKESLMAAAYAVVNTSVIYNDGVATVDALKMGIPVITSLADTDLPVIPIEPTDVTDIAAQLMRIYKDEDYRKDIIAKGLNFASAYGMDEAVSSVWGLIQQAAAVK